MSISRFKIVVAVATSLGLFFAALALSNGPHAKRFIADRKNGLVDTATRQLIFESSRKLDKNSVITLATTPTIDASTVIEDDRIVMNLREPLKYSYLYSIEIAGIKDTSGREGHFSANFQTYSPTFYYVSRANLGTTFGSEDRLMARDYQTDESTVVYKAERILSYAVGESCIVVGSSLTDNSSQQLERLYQERATVIEGLGDDVLLGELHADGSSDVFIISTFDKASQKSRAYVYDCLKNKLSELTQDGTPVDIIGGFVAPDGQTIVYQRADGFGFIDNPYDDSPAFPIGSVIRIVGFDSYGNSLIVETTADGFASIDDSGKVTRISDPASTIIALDSGSRSDKLALVVSSLSENLELASHIRVVGMKSKKQDLITIKSIEGTLQEIQLTDNNELLYYETAEQPATYDDYTINSRAIGTKTPVIDIENGEPIMTLDGVEVVVR